MKRIAVTGGSGKLGRYVVRDLLRHGYEVRNIDRQPANPPLPCETVYTQMQNLGEVIGALKETDAVIHLAGIPVAFLYPNEVTFQNNVMAAYHVLEACAVLKIGKAVIASSETAYGIGFARELRAPRYLPLDEEHPLEPEDPYGLSKVVIEQMAGAFHRRTGMEIVNLRFSYVHTPEMFANFREFNRNPQERVRNLWNYIDVRDAASACRLAAETGGLGCVAMNIAADETSMDLETCELIAAVFPELTDIRTDFTGFEATMSSLRARRLLGWRPAHHWRDTLREHSENFASEREENDVDI